MAEKNVTQEQIEATADNLTEVEIAELARKELDKEREKNRQLTRELAKAKLFTTVDDEPEEVMSSADCRKIIAASDTTNYDYWAAVIQLCKNETSENKPHPLGEHGEDIITFVEGVIEECEGDKTAFSSLYQARLGKDRPEDAAMYDRLTKKK